MFALEDETNMLSENVGNNVSSDTVQYVTRPKTSRPQLHGGKGLKSRKDEVIRK